MSEAKKSSPWVWLSLAVIILSFVAFILFLDQKIVKQGRQDVEQKQTQQNISKPVIDFYSVLPDRKVSVPEIQIDEEKKNPQKQAIKPKQGQYILQAGSFKKMKDADRRKAELAMMGLESKINSAQIKGKDYFRVELGPFEDDGFFSKVKSRLISNDIQYIAKSAN